MSVRNNSGIVRTGLILALDAADQSTFTLNEVEVLVVAGGGGGATGGGGGGAGGLVYNTSYKVTQGSAISVTVGNGGGNTSSWGGSGGRGQDSVFGNITANGGGPGSHRGNITGVFGSGGGDAGAGETILVGTIGQGKNGGLSRNITNTQEEPGGGGGGAGENGESTASTSGTFGDSTAPRNGIAGKGGNGLYFPQFAPFAGSPAGWFAGGGGGCNRSGYGRPGGLGGGGRGGKSPTAGVTNSGGGGGGTGYSGYNGGGTSAVGGSGIVIVRYPGPQKATGGNSIVQSNGHTIHIFTTSGTFTPLSSSSIKSTFYGLQDLSGNNYSATASGGVTYSDANRGSLVFDYTNDYLFTTGMENYSYNKGITISIWHYNGGGTGSYRGVVTNGILGDRTGGFDLRYGRENYFGGSNNGTNLNWAIRTLNGTSVISTGLSINANVNEWHNYVVTYDNTTLRAYKDGVLFTSTAHSFGGPLRTMPGSTIIGNSPGTPEFLDGILGPVYIYDRELSLTEIVQNFNVHKGRFGL